MSATLSVESISALQAGRVRQEIDVALLGKVQDLAKQQGEAVVALLESIHETAGAGGESSSSGIDVRV